MTRADTIVRHIDPRVRVRLRYLTWYRSRTFN